MRADNTHLVVTAARKRSQTTPPAAVQALRDLAADGAPVTFDAVAKAAGVSRSWLYSSDLRAEVERLRALSARAPASVPVPARQRASDASLRRRLEAANAELRRLRQENQQLRGQLAVALGERRAARTRPPAASTAAERSRARIIGPCS